MPMDHQLTQDTVNVPGTTDLIIFTDLDGTLLDHETYSFNYALPALNLLRQLEIPLILASSKTAAEIAPLREALGFSQCEAIVENGSGILEPHDMGEGSADNYDLLQQALNDLPPEMRLQYEGFSDWSAEQVSDRTGLSISDAGKAMQRRYSEPGLWLGSAEDREVFVTELSAKGISVLQGGRFLTLSFGGNKAGRMMEIIKRHERTDKVLFSVALGDAQNDIAMIEQADLGVIIPNPSHGGIARLEGEATGRIIRADSNGPAGWNKVIMTLLDQRRRTEERTFG